mmetsp:Transcript_7065/g.16484  ORF Transcript_7065/g.16484 Transcript_7065/m.16484 type:complete len:299 (-) Transcript_7065:182-1078(-)
MALRSRANHALKNLSVSLTASRTLMRTHVPFAASPVRSITTNPAQSGMTFIRHATTTTKFHGFLPNAASSHRHLSTEADSAALEESPPELRVQVLDAALNHVHQWGWTAQAIAAGAKDLGLSAYSHGLFPRGPIELVEHFQQTCEKEWVQELAKIDTSGQTTHEKLSAALRLRLSKQGAFMSTWPQALALQALPHHAPGAMATLAKICDVAWTHAGDRKRDLVAYSKRVALGGIYTGSELYMLTDYSEGFTDTFDFLDRQLKEAQKLGTTAEMAVQQAEQLMAAGLSAMQGHKDANRP